MKKDYCLTSQNGKRVLGSVREQGLVRAEGKAPFAYKAPVMGLIRCGRAENA